MKYVHYLFCNVEWICPVKSEVRDEQMGPSGGVPVGAALPTRTQGSPNCNGDGRF